MHAISHLKNLFLLVGLVFLTSCSTAPDTNQNLYAVSADKAFTILDNAEVPTDILPSEGVLNNLTASKETEPNKTITWRYDKDGHNSFSVRATLIPESANATRITIAITMADDPFYETNPDAKAVADLVRSFAVLKETIAQSFGEFVDSTLVARGYDRNRGGIAYAAQHRDELAAEQHQLEDVMGKLQAKLTALKAQANASAPQSSQSQSTPEAQAPISVSGDTSRYTGTDPLTVGEMQR